MTSMRQGAAPAVMRPRITTAVAGPVQVTVPLPERARRALSSISGDRPLEELAVLAASVARTIVLAEHTNEVRLAVMGPVGPVAVRVGLDDTTTPAQLLVTLDAALREAAVSIAPVKMDGAVLVRSRRVGDDAGVGAALQVTLDAPGGDRRDIVVDAAPGVAEPWFLMVLLRSVAAALAAFDEPRRPLAQAEAGSPEDLATARAHSRGCLTCPAGETTLTEWVSVAVAGHPDRPAVVAGERSLTYSQLWKRAGAVASRLVALGVKPGGRVGVCVGASIHALPAILGVLRAGAALVPLNPHAPAPWTADVLDDAGVEVILSDGSFGMDAGLRRIVVDMARDLPDTDVAVLTPESNTDDVVCVLYAPGSTGLPASVLVRNSDVTCHVQWRLTVDGPDGDVTLLHLPLPAGSLSDIFLVFAAGGRLVLADPARLEPAGLAGLVTHHRVSRIAVRLAEFEPLLDELAPAADSLRLVTVTGAPMSDDLIARHRAALPHVRLVTEYRPSGSPVAVAVFDHGAADTDACAGRPLGSPSPGTVARVVTANGRELPPGFVGALWLAGPGLADGGSGDTGRVAATAAAGSSVSSDRGFDTGDLAWWRPNGVLEFAGRAAGQLEDQDWLVPGRGPAALHGSGDPAEPDHTEAVLSELFRDALGGRPVAADDDFFLLGGHSLLALSMLEAISDRLGVVVDLEDFFAAATVRSVAEHVRDARKPGAALPADGVAAGQSSDERRRTWPAAR